MRPKQWAKNGILFAALVFSKNVFHLRSLTLSVTAFVLFCLLSGGAYLFNDLMDIANDRKHPIKSQRPLASGRLNPRAAKIASIVCFIISLTGSFLINFPLGVISSGYLILQIGYSTWLKEILLIDMLAISAGFFLRAVAGAKAIGVPISSWLLICTIFVSLFLGLGKRRHELVLLGEDATEHRKVFDGYNVGLLDQMVSVVTAGTVVSYSLYTLSQETVRRFDTESLWFTIPIVLYGIFRYLYLVYRKGEGGHPELSFFGDRPLLITIALYAVVVGIILYW